MARDGHPGGSRGGSRGEIMLTSGISRYHAARPVWGRCRENFWRREDLATRKDTPDPVFRSAHVRTVALLTSDKKRLAHSRRIQYCHNYGILSVTNRQMGPTSFLAHGMAQLGLKCESTSLPSF